MWSKINCCPVIITSDDVIFRLDASFVVAADAAGTQTKKKKKPPDQLHSGPPETIFRCDVVAWHAGGIAIPVTEQR